jgi:hypothetical protein
MVEWSKDLYVNPNSQTTLGKHASCALDCYRMCFHYSISLTKMGYVWNIFVACEYFVCEHVVRPVNTKSLSSIALCTHITPLYTQGNSHNLDTMNTSIFSVPSVDCGHDIITISM